MSILSGEKCVIFFKILTSAKERREKNGVPGFQVKWKQCVVFGA